MSTDKPLKISIAMATYNGGKYLQEQLESFLAQTRLPDELVITDDCSTDNTMEIIQAFKAESPFRVVLIENQSRLGFVQNFSKAISLCSGDLIFMSDQDDVWFSTKIKHVVGIADERPDISVFINDALITFEDLSVASGTMIERRLSRGLSLETHLTNGCQTAVRRSFVSMMMPIPGFVRAHDIWFHDMAHHLGEKLIIPEVLQYWRRHEESTCGFPALDPSPLDRSPVDRMKRFVHILNYGFESPVPVLEDRKDYLLSLLKILSQQEVRSKKKKIIQAQRSIKNEIEEIHSRLSVIRRTGFAKLFAIASNYFEGFYRFKGGLKSAIKDFLVSGNRAV